MVVAAANAAAAVTFDVHVQLVVRHVITAEIVQQRNVEAALAASMDQRTVAIRHFDQPWLLHALTARWKWLNAAIAVTVRRWRCLNIIFFSWQRDIDAASAADVNLHTRTSMVV